MIAGSVMILPDGVNLTALTPTRVSPPFLVVVWRSCLEPARIVDVPPAPVARSPSRASSVVALTVTAARSISTPLESSRIKSVTPDRPETARTFCGSELVQVKEAICGLLDDTDAIGPTLAPFSVTLMLARAPPAAIARSESAQSSRQGSHEKAVLWSIPSDGPG